MPDPVKTTAVKPDDGASGQPITALPPGVKEQEPGGPTGGEENRMMAEIKTTSDAIDQEMETKVQEQLAEAKLAHPGPEIPPDVEDAGVGHPETDAEKVVRDGSTFNVDVDEKTYKKGLHVKVAGAVRDKVVVGVSSLAALALWVGRLIKIAHKHTMKVIFKGGSSD